MTAKAMILAAGRGKRLKPLTDTTPKPLVEVRDRPLIEHHLIRLAKAGIHDIVINVSHLAKQIKERLGNGDRFGVSITYSEEEPPGLETGGGIVNALPLLGNEPFWVINSDVYCDYPFDANASLKGRKGHVVLVSNPPHNPHGDFNFVHGLAKDTTTDTPYTFGGIALYDPALFKDLEPNRFSVTHLLKKAMQQDQISGEIYQGEWHDIGTPKRLDTINKSNR